MSTGARYDAIGVGYTDRRRPDPRIERQVWAALGDARTVVNVGAGAGSYEPRDRSVIAVDPSAVMLAQRRVEAAPAVRAVAEALPFPNGAFDASLTVLTIHHWSDIERGLSELRRVARRHVMLTFDYEQSATFWGWRDYFSDAAALEELEAPTIDELADAQAEGTGGARVEVVPVPWDCTDGFGAGYWRRPEAYLDAGVRASISGLARQDPARVERAVERLRADLESGEWARRNAELLELDEADYGYRLVIAD